MPRSARRAELRARHVYANGRERDRLRDEFPRKFRKSIVETVGDIIH